MERKDDKIIFNEEEQRDYHVPASTTPQDALEIAEGFNTAAQSVLQQTNDYKMNDPVDSEPDMRKDIELDQRVLRAQGLIRMSHLIYTICAPEVVQKIIDSPESS